MVEDCLCIGLSGEVCGFTQNPLELGGWVQQNLEKV